MKNYLYDYLIVGAGFTGATIANILHNTGKKVYVIDKRAWLAGQAFTRKIEGIIVHEFGPHIFHTSDEEVWKYVNKFGQFNNYMHQPMVVAEDKNIYNLPFNMNLFSRIFGVNSPYEVKCKIGDEISFAGKFYNNESPNNLEEKALYTVGPTIYKLFIKNYTEKQWLRPAYRLPSEIISRIPLRFTYDNNYFNDTFQGIPVEGYTSIVKNMLKDIKCDLHTNYLKDKAYFDGIAKTVIYTGAIDEFYQYEYGELEYISRRFDLNVYESCNNMLGASVINYANSDVDYIRKTEHKHFDKYNTSNATVITTEYSKKFNRLQYSDRCYPVPINSNIHIYNKYASMPNDKVIFAGRLGEYKYYDMDKAIRNAMNLAHKIINEGE